MSEDFGELLKAEWDKHQDWEQLGRFVSARLVHSYRSGFDQGGRVKGIRALERLLVALKDEGTSDV